MADSHTYVSSGTSIGDDQYLIVLDSIRQHGRLPSKGFTKNQLEHYVSRLRKEGKIRRIGYGTWELSNPKTSISEEVRHGHAKPYPLTNTCSSGIRGHGFAWSLRIPKILHWQRREEFLQRENIEFKYLKGGQSIVFQGHKVHLFNKVIIIYSPDRKSYWDKTARLSQEQAFHSIAELIKELEEVLKVSFRIHGKHWLKLNKKHFGDVDNEFARERIKQHKAFKVSNDSGEWLLVDKSQDYVELETVHPLTADKDMDNVIKPFFNDLWEFGELNGKPILLSELWRFAGVISKNQAVFDANMKSHITAVQQLGKGVQRLALGVQEQVKVTQELRDDVKGLGKGSFSPLAWLKDHIHAPRDVLAYKGRIESLSVSERSMLGAWLFESDFGRR